MIKHVFFDFFGTLVDYDPSIVSSAHNAPHKFARLAGINLPPERTDELWQQAWDELDRNAHETGVECSMWDIAHRYATLLGEPNVSTDAIDMLITEYLDGWTRDIRPARGALECVAQLSEERGLGVSVVSNTHHPDLVPTLMRRFGFDEHIDTVLASVDVGWRKPHQRIFQIALAQQGIAASEAVFVGDNWVADVEGPAAVGMPSLYVGRHEQGRVPVPLSAVADLIQESRFMG